MKELERKLFNSAVSYLLPLYDYNYYINDEYLEFVGAYTYCPYIYTREDKLFVAYKIKKKPSNIDFPDVFLTKEYQIGTEHILVVVLNVPEEFKWDWQHILDFDFKNVSILAKIRIKRFKRNRSMLNYIWDVIHCSPNLSYPPGCKPINKFGTNEILNW